MNGQDENPSIHGNSPATKPFGGSNKIPIYANVANQNTSLQFQGVPIYCTIHHLLQWLLGDLPIRSYAVYPKTRADCNVLKPIVKSMREKSVEISNNALIDDLKDQPGGMQIVHQILQAMYDDDTEQEDDHTTLPTTLLSESETPTPVVAVAANAHKANLVSNKSALKTPLRPLQVHPDIELGERTIVDQLQEPQCRLPSTMPLFKLLVSAERECHQSMSFPIQQEVTLPFPMSRFQLSPQP